MAAPPIPKAATANDYFDAILNAGIGIYVYEDWQDAARAQQRLLQTPTPTRRQQGRSPPPLWNGANVGVMVAAAVGVAAAAYFIVQAVR